MNGLKSFILPLGIFVGGEIILAMVSIFFPAMHAQTQIAQANPHISSFPWVSTLLTSTRLIIFMGGTLAILLVSAIVWLIRR